MAAKPNIHTVPDPKGGWRNVREGSDRAINKAPTKVEAQAAGREVARRDKVEHLIHKQDGTIGARNSYGIDRADRPG